jgi:hypothetical protein
MCKGVKFKKTNSKKTLMLAWLHYCYCIIVF